MHRQLGVTIAWFIWKMRNENLNLSAPIHLGSIRYKKIFAIFEQNLSNFVPISGPIPDLPPHIWLPPPPLSVKFNFDGSLNPLAAHTGIGGIIRNSSGHLITAFAGKVKAAHSIEAELQALLLGIEICIELGHRDVILYLKDIA